MQDWKLFLAPYSQAVEELKIKLKGIREQYKIQSIHSPIEYITGRVKPIHSIIEKAKRKNISLDDIEENLYDIAGVRMVCQFKDDIDYVIHLLRKRKDFEIVEERDYIHHKKDSGYRSYHIVIRYPVETINGTKHIFVEIQIRTLAMNFWATIEHSLNYKYHGQIPKDIQNRLLRASEAASQLDEEMSIIREEVQEAQRIFLHKEENE
ncbi:GTP pyrophosphokinase [Calidifontibacillus oryziterrae]|uniref:GTP pyrophosphokinase n=1 Tax=Calidifontibacillus oryziterrae TaxID=1191699 RepID=UPI000309FF90|nr:GTP pyrophosphokinase family protein [Calidifontibacillus oryziterrae]